ncbi:nucleotidyltransferase family protein [Pseudaestuariivita sp.]|uniref:nucleotidyltransferase family protein n=1 Tax=Pseudaestuariivita sp. TaxID=2211669 RepID=UPI004057FC96
MTPTGAMFFAAGFGTRMRPLTHHTPKPLIEVAGRPLLDHARAQIEGHDIGRQVVNAHHHADQIAAYAEAHGLTLSHETPKILDTGGGLKHALPLLGKGPVVTLNTDAVWTGPPALSSLIAAWDPARMDALLLCVPIGRVHGRSGVGDFTLNADGALSRGGTLVYTGAQIIAPEVVAAHPEDVFSLNAIWTRLAAKGRLHGTSHPGAWCDVGHPGGIAIAQRMLTP